MNDVKGIIIALSVSFIIYGVVMLLTPAGDMGKMFKTAVGIALICTVTFSVLSYEPEFDLEFGDVSANVADIGAEGLAVASAETALEDYISSALNERGVLSAKVEVIMDISDENSISIQRVEVKCGSSDRYVVEKTLTEMGVPYTLTENENDRL